MLMLLNETFRGFKPETHQRRLNELQFTDVTDCPRNARKKMKGRLTVSLEEKELSLKTLEENNLAQHNKVSQLPSALRQAEQLHSDHRREIQELNNQVQSLQEAALEEEAGLAAREEQLLRDLEESQAGERCSRNSLRMLEAEVSELCLRLCSTESRAQALATGCQQANSAPREARSQLDKLHLVLQRTVCDSRDLVPWSSEQGHAWGPAVSQARDLPAELTVDRVAAALRDLRQHLEQTQQDLKDARKKIQDSKLELSKRQAEKEYFSACNQELQKQLAQSQEETQMAEHRKNSLQSALQEEAAALKKETVTLHQEVAPLERKLETTEKHRKDVLQAAAEGEQLSWLLEKRLLSQRLERLQQAVARLELEKKELKQLIAELRRTLEQVERERRRLKRCCWSLPDARGFSLSDQH
ncbi:centrosome-associated protein CEP250-like [Strix uralensis]|uniref:centrosome-associated protein CEP250-like n=1 Tax=Strix uralensis TaxID=36305 RepID=UPI003DA2CC36